MKPCQTPDGALLNRYRNISPDGEAEAYTDCYSIKIDRAVTLREFVFSFYTTPIFKLERLILKLLVARPSTDDEAKQLADGSRDTFAAWTVEERTAEQLLMCDFRKRTRSWFMVSPLAETGEPGTVLYFGSAVVAVKNHNTGKLELDRGFRALLGFHKLYSKVLLYAVRSPLHTTGLR